VLETVERLEEDLTDVATAHRPFAVRVSVSEPIAVTADGPRPTELTSEVRDRIETLLDIRSASDRAPGTARGSAPPGSGSSVGIAAGSPCPRCSADRRSWTRGLPDFDGSDAGLDGALGEVAIAEQLAASPVIPLIGVGLDPGGTSASMASVKTSWPAGCGTMRTYVVDSLRAGHSSGRGPIGVLGTVSSSRIPRRLSSPSSTAFA
jgi:hypothetical protein